MVRNILPEKPAADTLKAFLVTKLSATQLDEFKRTFEKGAKVNLNPLLHLKIIKATKDYLNAPHAYIRTHETETGNTDPVVVIDGNQVEKNAVWYVSGFADENDVEAGFAESEDVLMRALIRTEALAVSHVCWQEGNPPMGEELEALDSGLVPLRLDSVQSEPVGAEDEGDELWSADEIEVIAEVGEYEMTTDYDIRSNMSPIPDEVVRLLPSVERRGNLISDWTWGDHVSRDTTPDGCSDSHVKGSVRMSARYDPSVPRARYQWPEGSL
jgi:hypothetical protein